MSIWLRFMLILLLFLIGASTLPGGIIFIISAILIAGHRKHK